MCYTRLSICGLLQNVAPIYSAEVMKRQESRVYWLKVMTNSAEPGLSFISGQDEALCPVSIDFLNFASLCVIRHRSITRRGFLAALITGGHSLLFDTNLIMTAC